MTKTTLPESLDRLAQDHIEMRTALNMLEREVEAVAQYHQPNGDLLGGGVQYFANFPARCHHPIEELIYHVLKARAPLAASESHSVAQHQQIVERIGELALMTRNLFLDAPKWRIPFCATARNFIVLKRDHIREEEKGLFRLALDHLTTADWVAIDHAASAANAKWNDDPSSLGAIDALGLRSSSRSARASASAHRA